MKIKKTVLKIENGNISKLELEEKKLKEYQKKYMHYTYNDLIIFNFDYNLVKPYVVRLLQLKGFYDDYNKITIIIIILILFIFIGIFYLFNNSISTKVNSIKQDLQEQIIKNQNNLLNLKNKNDKIYNILSKAYSGYVDNDNLYNPINGAYSK